MDVVLPKNSLTMTEAEIIEWLVPIGGQVTAGEALFIMETEKSQVEVQATVSGTLVEILAAPGDIPIAGDIIARIETTGENNSSSKSFAHDVVTEISIAPAAAELAQQLGLDIATIRGSGAGGRVIEEDVLKAVSAPAVSPVAVQNLTGGLTPAAGSKKRQAGNKATRWASDVPTFYVARKLQLPAKSDEAGTSDHLISAVARALRRVPIANAVFMDDKAFTYNDIKVGLLVRDDDALIPLVFTNPDQQSVAQINAQRREWMKQIETKASTSTAITSGATFVISNIGRAGVTWFTAVLFPGTAATLAVGGLASDGTVEVVLTCDHRVLDGVDAADFLASLAAELMEISNTHNTGRTSHD